MEFFRRYVQEQPFGEFRFPVDNSLDSLNARRTEQASFLDGLRYSFFQVFRSENENCQDVAENPTVFGDIQYLLDDFLAVEGFLWQE